MALKFGLVGCGRISHRHAQILTSGQIHNAKLIAVCDVDAQKASDLSDQYGVTPYTDMIEMTTKEQLDVCVILTPSGMHAENTIRLAPFCSSIIVEKPMALTLDQADAMIAACDASSTRLFVVKQNRFNLPVIKTKEAIEKEEFGRLVLGTVRVRWCRDQQYYDNDAWRGTWSMDGGVLTNQASHHIDLLIWLMGNVSSVFARSTTALVDIEAEDTAVATLQFENGALGIIEATTATRPKNLEGSLSILGESGSAVIGGVAVNRFDHWYTSTDAAREGNLTLEEFSESPPDVYGFGHRAYYEDAIDCIINSKKNLVDGLEGRRSLEVISALYESIETGQEVALRFKPQRCRLGLGPSK